MLTQKTYRLFADAIWLPPSDRHWDSGIEPECCERYGVEHLFGYDFLLNEGDIENHEGQFSPPKHTKSYHHAIRPGAMTSPYRHAHKFSVAPMMNWTRQFGLGMFATSSMGQSGDPAAFENAQNQPFVILPIEPPTIQTENIDIRAIS